MNDLVSMKVILVGSTGVGKTCLLNTFRGINEETQPTIGAENIEMEIVNGRNTRLKLSLWDTAGQEQYQSMTTIYYRFSNIALLCFDFPNKNSLNKWKQAVLDVSPNCVIIPVITKSDLYNDDQINELQKVAEGFLNDDHLLCQNYFVTSARENSGISELFAFIGDCDKLVTLESFKKIDGEGEAKVASCC